MKHIISISECVDLRETEKGPCEVCATADANYDVSKNRVAIRLASFLRPVPSRIGAEPFREPWMPADETVTECAPLEDADALARDVFQSWVRRVREAETAPVT